MAPADGKDDGVDSEVTTEAPADEWHEGRDEAWNAAIMWLYRSNVYYEWNLHDWLLRQSPVLPYVVVASRAEIGEALGWPDSRVNTTMQRLTAYGLVDVEWTTRDGVGIYSYVVRSIEAAREVIRERHHLRLAEVEKVLRALPTDDGISVDRAAWDYAVVVTLQKVAEGRISGNPAAYARAVYRNHLETMRLLKERT